MSLLQKLLRRPANQPESRPKSAEAEAGPPSVGAGFTDRITDGSGPMARAFQGEDNQEEYAEFVRTFCFKPDTNFAEYLRANDIWKMEQWLAPASGDPFARAFIRLALETQRRGENFWEQTGISMFWSQPGEPGPASEDPISVLCQILEMPIKIYYHNVPDGPLMLKEYAP